MLMCSPSWQVHLPNDRPARRKPPQGVRMTCKQLTEFIADYRSETLPPAARAEFEAHLAECPDCLRYLQTYEDTVRLARGVFAATGDPLPTDVPEELVQAILAARAKAKHEH
jgi:anti-sigma factor RsiW